MKLKNPDMTERSYAQIRLQQDRFGLLMVNALREKFFLFADKLKLLYADDAHFHVLKLRDRKPGRAIGYYPGQVIGTVDKDEEFIKITIYISEANCDVTFIDVEGAEVPGVYLTSHVFTFPRKEFVRFKNILDVMLDQAQEFSEMLRAAEMTRLKTRRDAESYNL